MTARPVSLEEQLRVYADEIDPSGASDPARSQHTPARRIPSVLPYAALAVAAAVLAVVAIFGSQPDGVQRVDTAEVAAQRDVDNSGPAQPSGETAQEADYEAILSVGRYWLTREEELVISLAESTLTAECVRELGHENSAATDAELIALFGEWKPNGVLGVGRTGAAHSLGYRSAEFGGFGSPSQALAFQQLSVSEQNGLTDALRQCRLQVVGELGGGELRRTDLWNRLVGSDETQGEKWRTDPTLAAAIASWQECMRSTVSIEADTPNTLARRYAFSTTPLTAEEQQIAVADAGCQAAAGLEVAFYTAQARGIAEQLGDDVHLWQEYGVLTEELLTSATKVLADRNITPPPLG